MTTAQWDAVLDVNLRGPFFATRAVVPHMIAAGWGRIVNISSISALGDAGRVGYASAKAGLIGFTKTLSIELGPSGVTVNAVAQCAEACCRIRARDQGVSQVSGLLRDGFEDGGLAGHNVEISLSGEELDFTLRPETRDLYVQGSRCC